MDVNLTDVSFIILTYLHKIFKYYKLQSISYKVVRKKMRIVSEINTKQELEDMKVIMEIFVVNNRIKQLAEIA